jgi:hypothetical protein
MADDNTTTADESKDSTSNADGKQADDSKTGADTQAAKTTEANDNKLDKSGDDKLYTEAEAKKRAEDLVSKTVMRKLRAELIKRGIDPDAKEGDSSTKPTVEQLSKRAEDAEQRLRVFEARDQLETFISDKRNNVQVRNVRGLFKYIKDDLEFDDEGNVTNFREVLAQAKNEASELFGQTVRSIDAGAGARQNGAADMNSLIRHAAGR